MEARLAEAATSHAAALAAAEGAAQSQVESQSGATAAAAAAAAAQVTESTEAAEAAAKEASALRENLGLVVEKYTALRESARTHIESLTEQLAAKAEAAAAAESRSEGMEAAKAAAAVYEADLERSHAKCADLERRLDEALAAAELSKGDGVSEEEKKSLSKVGCGIFTGQISNFISTRYFFNS